MDNTEEYDEDVLYHKYLMNKEFMENIEHVEMIDELIKEFDLIVFETTSYFSYYCTIL